MALPLTTLFGFLVNLLIQKIKLNNLNIKGDKWEQTKFIAAVSVQSAEQQHNSGTILDKKSHAMETAKKLLKEKKIPLDDDLLSELIESEVWEGINSPVANPITSNSSNHTVPDIKEPSESEALG